MITIWYFFAVCCMRRVVGPSGIISVASYQRGVCSAQKYGPVKISCMQRIWTPSLPALSMSFMCFSTLALRMVSIFSFVSQAWEAWIRPHRTVWGIYRLRMWLLSGGVLNGVADKRSWNGVERVEPLQHPGDHSMLMRLPEWPAKLQ